VLPGDRALDGACGLLAEGLTDAGCVGLDQPSERAFTTRKLHKRLHTHRTLGEEQVDLNTKAPTCGAFAEPSNGLEPLTPSLPSKLSGKTGGNAWQRFWLV